MKKRLLSLFLAVIFLFSSLAFYSHAARSDARTLPAACVGFIRAGGGESGGSSSGGGGSSGSSSRHSSNGVSSTLDPISALVLALFGLAASSIASLVFHLELSKHARRSKKLMRMLNKKDSAWKYKDILRQVRDTYYAVQRAWTDLDMSPARKYMSGTLYTDHSTKLAWMKLRGEHNILKSIRLLDAIPVAVYDDEDNTGDFVWFYIKGRMIDYTVDTNTGYRIRGSNVPEKFGEYWQFTRTAENLWVLNSILQTDEAELIPFTSK